MAGQTQRRSGSHLLAHALRLRSVLADRTAAARRCRRLKFLGRVAAEGRGSPGDAPGSGGLGGAPEEIWLGAPGRAARERGRRRTDAEGDCRLAEGVPGASQPGPSAAEPSAPGDREHLQGGQVALADGAMGWQREPFGIRSCRAQAIWRAAVGERPTARHRRWVGPAHAEKAKSADEIAREKQRVRRGTLDGGVNRSGRAGEDLMRDSRAGERA